MKLVADILATYNEIDAFLFQKFNNALNAGDQSAQQAISERRILTDNAFLSCSGDNWKMRSTIESAR